MQPFVTSRTPLSLYQASVSTDLKVLLVQGGWGARHRLNQIGIHEGDLIQVRWKAPFGGPLVIENLGVQVAIGKQLAEKVQVEVLP